MTDAQREAFANDPANLLAVDAGANRSKGSQTPATWTPINRDMACEYGITFLEVSEKYDLKVQQADIDSVQLSCGDAR